MYCVQFSIFVFKRCKYSGAHWASLTDWLTDCECVCVWILRLFNFIRRYENEPNIVVLNTYIYVWLLCINCFYLTFDGLFDMNDCSTIEVRFSCLINILTSLTRKRSLKVQSEMSKNNFKCDTNTRDCQHCSMCRYYNCVCECWFSFATTASHIAIKIIRLCIYGIILCAICNGHRIEHIYAVCSMVHTLHMIHTSYIGFLFLSARSLVQTARMWLIDIN